MNVYISTLQTLMNQNGKKEKKGIVFSKQRKLNIFINDIPIYAKDVNEAFINFSFPSKNDKFVIIGEIPLLQDEIYDAEKILIPTGATISAIHNHWLSKPCTLYLHFQFVTIDPFAFASSISHWWQSLK